MSPTSLLSYPKRTTLSTPITQLLSNFNSTCDRWLADLGGYSPDFLLRIHTPGHWSMGQVYVHVLGDGEWYLEQMRLALASDDHSDQSMNASGRQIFNAGGFPDVRMENPNNDNMPQPTSKEELTSGYRAFRENVNRLFEGLDDITSMGKTEHPGFGYFSAAEWLQFAEMHMRHHERQKRRIENAEFGIQN